MNFELCCSSTLLVCRLLSTFSPGHTPIQSEKVPDIFPLNGYYMDLYLNIDS